MRYIKGKGYFVGTFNEEDIMNKSDKVAIQKAMEETGMKYVNTEYLKKGKKIIGINLYVCSLEEVQDWGI